MKAEILDEPELEFAAGTRHVDPRFGVLNYGPVDAGTPDAPRAIRIGLVGPSEDVDGLRAWLERCREPIPAKDQKYPHLFPAFPGCDLDVGLRTTLVCSDRNTRSISSRDLRAIGRSSGPEAVNIAVAAYAHEITGLSDENRVDVLLVARPQALADGAAISATTTPAADSGPGAERSTNFHDLLKARVLGLRQPIQIVRRSTWDETTAPPKGRSRQDEASRAWNIHVAMYYKAGGVPWRLQRNATDLTTCFVGVSFYRNLGNDTLDTSVAQVFNERGDGVIVRGGPARIGGDDRQPHLSEQGAADLLTSALTTYRAEHHTTPARVVLHKTSSFTAEERAGFQAAADAQFLEFLDLCWLTSSEGAQLFRPGAAPPLRGTLLTLSPDEHILYTTGSVEFYSTYPGMYVPRPIGIRPVGDSRSPTERARELLALTKMNWNQTRLDGRLPVTLRTANQVKAVLRLCGPDQAIATRYAHYM